MATGAGPAPAISIMCTLGDVLDARGMTLRELSERTGITPANLSILKNNHGRAIRFTTLAALCAVLDCEVSDLLRTGPARPS